MSKEKLRQIIGENIKRRRTALGMSAEELGDLLGLSTASITMIEAGRRGATVHTLHKLTDIFNVTVDEMLKEPTTEGKVKVNENDPLKSKKDRILAHLHGFSLEELEFCCSIIQLFKKFRSPKKDERHIEDETE